MKSTRMFRVEAIPIVQMQKRNVGREHILLALVCNWLKTLQRNTVTKLFGVNYIFIVYFPLKLSRIVADDTSIV